MPKQRKTWVYRPSKPRAPQVPPSVKTAVQQKANELVETVLKPKHIQPPPAPGEFQRNYIVDLYTKWVRHYFYFCATYCVPGPNALAPSFESKFARLEYVGANRFHLAFMRHNGEWIQIYENLSLDECLARVTEDGFFQP